VVDFETRLIERLSALPGVVAAGAGSNLPMTGGASGTAFAIDGRPTPAGQLPPIVRYRFTSPGYVETMGLRVLQGRTFDQRDLKDGSRDILVNKAAADTFWPGVNPIGKRLRPSGDSGNDWYTVVGVVGSELQDGFRKDPPLMLYWGLGAPFQDGARTLGYVVRGAAVTQNPAAVREAVWAIDPKLPVALVQSMDEVVARSIVPFTFTMLTLGLAAAMALALGMIGPLRRVVVHRHTQGARDSACASRWAPSRDD
jgi:putative ABC transport system permease protein